MKNEITEGNLLRAMVRFSVPYLIACFLQTFYGLADLFITGQFEGADVVSAVAVGSQVMHMLTVMIVGLAMGTTVSVGKSVGAGRRDEAGRFIGNSVTLFAAVSAVLTVVLILCAGLILTALQAPEEAFAHARRYLVICFAGIPFITAYNVIGGIFRGLGDTKHPMVFVAVSGVINIGLDWLFIGPMHMGAGGAALATVIAQALSVVLALWFYLRMENGIVPKRRDFVPAASVMGQILSIGLPITCQDGLIQISFLIITAIANKRGVEVAAAVGIVEKIISFLFLVPSAMLSTVSALTAQNLGAGKPERGRQVLRFGVSICVVFGLAVFAACQFVSPQILSLFQRKDPEVVRLGAQYLRSYSLDCVFAGIHFCFSGYFSANGKSLYSFLHNILSIALMRVPGAYLASRFFPETLYPMGLAAPFGSALSAIICVFLYRRLRRQQAEGVSGME